MTLTVDDDLRLDRLLCFAVYSANLAFSRAYRAMLDRIGLTYVQYLVLVALWETDDLLVGEVGDRLFLTSSTLTPVLKRLEVMGHVARSRDPGDERQVRVRLTEAGRQLKAAATEIPGCILTASGLDQADAGHLLAAVTRLRDHLLTQAEAAETHVLPTTDD